MILRAQPIGSYPALRYVIQNLNDNCVWNGETFIEDWEKGRMYAKSGDACADMGAILRKFYGELPRKRYVCPIEIEVYGDASRAKIARYLHQASFLNVKTHEYGNGPGECLVLPVIHFGLLKEIEDVPMLSQVKNYENDDEDWGVADESDNSEQYG